MTVDEEQDNNSWDDAVDNDDDTAVCCDDGGCLSLSVVALDSVSRGAETAASITRAMLFSC